MDEFNFQYYNLLEKLYFQKDLINNRTKSNIKALPNQIISYNITEFLPVLSCRKMYPLTAFAELCWMLMGKKELSWLQKYTKMWDKFANVNNEIEASYGYRWREQFGRDQILNLIEALYNDISDRQCFVSSWDPCRDGLGNRWTSNVPCPTSFCVNVINDKVNLTLFIRSSDVIVGLPYDCMTYTMLLIAITNQLKVKYKNLEYGNFTAILSNAHVYSSHLEIIENILNNKELARNQNLYFENSRLLWELVTINNILLDPDEAVDNFKLIIASNRSLNFEFPPIYKPEVIL